MFGGGGNVARQVAQLVEQWNPSQVYDHERKYQSELQEFLDSELNSQQGGFGMNAGGGGHVVSTERGVSRGDVVVDDVVGIELKRNFSNSQKKKLRGQLEDYADNYDFVIACACGIEDMDGWRELENKVGGSRQGFMDATQFKFVIKRREEMGSTGGSGNGGLLGGGGLF